MTTATRNLVAVTPGGDITDDMLAGYYTWYSIPEDMLSLRTVRKAFRDNGLDEERLPRERRPEHVAQEACRKTERVESNGHREEVRAEQVLRENGFLIYQITKHVQDKEQRVIEHPKALRVLFNLNREELSFEPLDGRTHADVQELEDEIQANYDANTSRIPGRKLRTILRHYIEAAGAEYMRNGVYFLPQHNPIRPSNKLYDHHGALIDGQVLLSQVHAMLTQLYRAADMHIVPCVNDEGQRAFLKRKFIENSQEAVKAYRDKCLELVKSAQTPEEEGGRKRSFREDKRAAMIEQRKEIDARKQQFADILGETLEELDRDMSLADRALAKFLTEADS